MTREEIRQRARDYRQRLKDAAYAVLGGYICTWCRFSDPRALQIDHRQGDGYKDHKLNQGAPYLYRDVVRHPDRYQVLCCNCNWIKRYDNKEFPRKRHDTDPTQLNNKGRSFRGNKRGQANEQMSLFSSQRGSRLPPPTVTFL